MTKSNEAPGTDLQNTESDVDRFLRETHDLANEISSIHPRLHALLEKANEIQAGRSHGHLVLSAFLRSTIAKDRPMTNSNEELGTDLQNTDSDMDRFVRKTHDLANEVLSIHPRLHALLKKADEIQASRS